MKQIFCVFLCVVLCKKVLSDEFSEIVRSSNINDPECRKFLQEYSNGLRVRKYWALKMFDSNAKLQSGILSGNLVDFGSFDQCLSIKANTSIGYINGKYCLGIFTLPLNTSNQDVEVTDYKNLTWAMCIPDSCKGTELATVYSNVIGSYVGVNDLILHVDEKLCQTESNAYPALSIAAKATIIFLLILACLIISSTLYDIYNFYYKLSPLHDALIAFSMLTNGKTLWKTNTNPDQLLCLHGIRTISIIWIILLHEYSIFPNGPVVNSYHIDDWNNSIYSMYVTGGNVAVDTFFVISGFLTTYTFFKKNNASFNLPMYYLHRYLRLTPALAAAVLINATLLKYLGSGPYWIYFVNNFQKPCEEYWWSTLLYVENYVNVTRMCVGHAWYLAVDMQLFFISPILLMLFKKWPKIAYALIPFLILASISLSFAAAWGLNLTAILSNKYGNKNIYMNKYYLLTHTRASAWLIGFLFGRVVLELKKNKIKINKMVVILLWILTFAVLALCVFGGHQTLRSENYNKWGNTIHIALVKPTWAVGLCWIIFACIFEYGGPINKLLSQPFFQILSKLTYSTYIIHVTMLFMNAYSRKISKEFNDFVMVYNFWGDCCLSLAVAVVWVLAFEAPVIALEKSFTKRK